MRSASEAAWLLMSSFAQEGRCDLWLSTWVPERVVGRCQVVVGTVCGVFALAGGAAGRDAWTGRPMGRPMGSWLYNEEGKYADARRGCGCRFAQHGQRRVAGLFATHPDSAFFLFDSECRDSRPLVANSLLLQVVCRPINDTLVVDFVACSSRGSTLGQNAAFF